MDARGGVGSLGEPIADPLGLKARLFGFWMERADKLNAAGLGL